MVSLSREVLDMTAEKRQGAAVVAVWDLLKWGRYGMIVMHQEAKLLWR
jgi:hypothetical protein